MAKIPVALQLYTVRDETAKDFAGTVRQVAAMGYAGVEFAGTGGLSAVAMADLLAETKLQPAGAHVGLGVLESALDAEIVYHQAIGNPWIGVPALPGELRNPAGFHQVARTMNKIGATLKNAGLRLYYHNHAFEFERMAGQRGMDILLAETDPALVGFECDVYWVHYAGDDPAGLIRAHAGRFPLIHLKDMVGAGEQRTWAEVGEGIIPFEPIFAASETQGAVWYIVEQDRCARPSLDAARMSLDNLRKWGKA